MTEPYDTIVIGSGGGTKITQALERLGIKAALIERDQAGGTCLNRGCIPSKMLIYPSGVQQLLLKLKDLRIHAGIQSVDFARLVSEINAYTDETSASIDDTYEKAHYIDYYRGHATFVEDKVLTVGDYRLSADRIIIATGSRPHIPNIPGLQGTPYMTSTEALRNRVLPKSLIVLGGGYIAAELGGAYAGFGSPVQMVVRSALLKREDADILAEFKKEYGADKTLFEHTQTQSVEYDESGFHVQIAQSDRPSEILHAEALLVATGIVPNSDTIGLENTAIERNSTGFIQTNEFLETSVPGIFSIGDVSGNYLFRHSVNFEGEYWVESNLLADKPFPIQYPPMPGAVFTHPEIASVGLTEAAAQKEQMDTVVGSAPYSSCVMAKARGISNGLVKLVFNRTDQKLIGAHITGDEASTMIQEQVLACTLGLTASAIYRQIYIHPAFPEVIRNAVRNALIQLDDKYKILL